jgi:hypothetical protein
MVVFCCLRREAVRLVEEAFEGLNASRPRLTHPWLMDRGLLIS